MTLTILLIGIIFIVLLSILDLLKEQRGGDRSHHQNVNKAIDNILNYCPKDAELPGTKKAIVPKFCIKLFTINPIKKTTNKKVSVEQCPKLIKEHKMFSYYVAYPKKLFHLADHGDCYTARQQSNGSFLLESVKYRKNYVAVSNRDKKIYLRPLNDSDSKYGWKIVKGLDTKQQDSISLLLDGTRDKYIITDGNQLILSSVKPGEQGAKKSGSKIKVIEASYGPNCGVKAGNVTSQLAAACDGKPNCRYRVDHRIIGDPAYGCRKIYKAKYSCGGKVKEATAGPEASGKEVELRCGPNKSKRGSPKYLGCYRDRPKRALAHGPRKYGYNRDSCSKACKDYSYFALQNNGWCSCSNSLKEATRYGRYHTCPPSKRGGPWGNDLFQQGGGAKKWKCLDDINVPVRRGSSGDIECMSKNQRDCLWQKTPKKCQSLISSPPSNIKPLVCGAMTKQKWGITGYNNPDHWCAKAKKQLSQKEDKATASSDHLTMAQRATFSQV